MSEKEKMTGEGGSMKKIYCVKGNTRLYFEDKKDAEQAWRRTATPANGIEIGKIEVMESTKNAFPNEDKLVIQILAKKLSRCYDDDCDDPKQDCGLITCTQCMINEAIAEANRGE